MQRKIRKLLLWLLFLVPLLGYVYWNTDWDGLGYKLTGLNKGIRASQDGLVYETNADGSFKLERGKKIYRSATEISEGFYAYITNAPSFKYVSPLVSRRAADDPVTSTLGGGGYNLPDGRRFESGFLVIHLLPTDDVDMHSYSLCAGVLEDVTNDMDFSRMIEVMGQQIDEIWKEMYPEDEEVLEKIKLSIPENITIYTNMENHREKTHFFYIGEAVFGQYYDIRIETVEEDDGNRFYNLKLARNYYNL